MAEARRGAACGRLLVLAALLLAAPAAAQVTVVSPPYLPAGNAEASRAVWIPAGVSEANPGYCASTTRGCAYILGGLHSRDIVRFDPSDGASGGSLTVFEDALPTPRWAMGAVFTGDRILMFGGSIPKPAELTPQILSYKPGADKAEVVGTLSSGRTAASAVFVPADAACRPPGCAYIIGGNNFGNALAEVVRFDPATGTASPATRLPTPRWGTSAVYDAVTGEILVFGGRAERGFTFYDEVLAFQPLLGGLPRVVATLPYAREETAAFAMGDFAYVLGGVDEGRASRAEIVRVDLESYQVEEWGQLDQARSYFSATHAEGDVAYAFGGAQTTSIVRFGPLEPVPPPTSPSFTRSNPERSQATAAVPDDPPMDPLALVLSMTGLAIVVSAIIAVLVATRDRRPPAPTPTTPQQYHATFTAHGCPRCGTVVRPIAGGFACSACGWKGSS